MIKTSTVNVENCVADEESRLAKTLKDICDENGKEKDSVKAAEIFHELGILYQRKAEISHSKICLIQSAALLNAAVAREPENKTFTKDLRDFCSYVLNKAQVKNQGYDLVEISNKIAKKVTTLRKIVLKILEISASGKSVVKQVKKNQRQISQKYINVMHELFQTCISIFEGLPCKFAIAGLGSLARNEITPYSDFEHIILLENGIEDDENYSETQEQFRWFSLIFLIILINLQETIIPSVAIPSLNDYTTPGGNWFYDAYTTRGITLDGLMAHACKNPLGRTFETKDKPWITELIKPVNKMLEYLKSDVSLKNGYHLDQILLQSCYVSGDKGLYEQFVEAVRRKKKENKFSTQCQVMQGLNEDLKNFDAFTDLMRMRETTQCNIKRVIYRSVTLFISALGRMYNIDEASSFSVVKSLKGKQIIDHETAEKLKLAVAVACKVRLSRYMEYKSQHDYVNCMDRQVTVLLKKYAKMEDIVQYFVIALALQKVLRNLDPSSLPAKLTFSFQPYMKYMVAYKLGYYDYITEDWKRDQVTMGDPWGKYYVARSLVKMLSYKEALNILKSVDTTDKTLSSAVRVDIGFCQKSRNLTRTLTPRHFLKHGT
ncbi:unnamed protein product [Clavelina lepadiformis]|uniref:Protein-PII uridylyltransferase N-terminal domain-containing protein n=1 Tax=Clavelina lepadiformis TaxID=159417 RepID=A0ABP0FKE0_CLALP